MARPVPRQRHRASKTAGSKLDFDLFLRAVALVLVFEGLMPFIAPGRWRETFTRLLQFGDDQLRRFGLFSIVIGLILLWML